MQWSCLHSSAELLLWGRKPAAWCTGKLSSISGSVSFTSLNLTEFRGSLELEASYSTVGLDLVDDPAGYDVYVEAAFGAVEGGLALERQQERNTLIARGVVHRGELPIQILSRFSTVKLNLK